MTARRKNRSRSLARPIRAGVGLPCTVGAEFRYAPYGPPGAQSRQRLRACRWCLPPRLGLVARRRAVRGPPPFATLYNGPQAARRWRGLPGARGAARSRPRVALVCAALGPPRRNARRGVPKPSKVCEKNAARRGQRAALPPLGARVPLPPWRLFRPRAYPPPSPPASVAGGGRGRFWLPSPGGGARSTRRQGAGGVRPLPACCSFGPSPRPVFSLPPPASSLAGRLFPLRLGWLLSFLLSAWRPAVGGPRRPCGRQWYTESAQCWSTF